MPVPLLARKPRVRPCLLISRGIRQRRDTSFLLERLHGHIRMSAFAPSLPSAGAVTEVCSGSDSSGLSLLTGTAGIGALLPMTVGVTVGSDLAATSRAGIARSCPHSGHCLAPAHPFQRGRCLRLAQQVALHYRSGARKRHSLGQALAGLIAPWHSASD
jgi:hypothetical protein